MNTGRGIKFQLPVLKYYPTVFLEGLGKTTNSSVRLADLRPEFRISIVRNDTLP